MTAQAGPGAPRGWWQCRAVRPDGSAAWLALVSSSRHAEAERVELPDAEAREVVGDDAVCVASYDDRARVVSLEVTATGAPKAPPLWFVELAEPGPPPAVHLMAFSGHGVAGGTLLASGSLGDVVVGNDDQLGSVRWYPATGEVDQIYVSPDWRRRSIASALIAAAGTLSVARDRPRLWGDGQRTELGEQWRSGRPWAHRAAALTHVSPPMTPAEPESVEPESVEPESVEPESVEQGSVELGDQHP